MPPLIPSVEKQIERRLEELGLVFPWKEETR